MFRSTRKGFQAAVMSRCGSTKTDCDRRGVSLQDRHNHTAIVGIAALKVDDSPHAAVKYKPLDLLRFVSNDFGPMNAMCEQAEMSERIIYDRSKAVFEYFKIPFDAEPPP
jgi:hypothetical protein